MKRLFIFAAYTKANVVSDTLLNYINFLNDLGDLVVFFDSNVDTKELKKVTDIKNVLYAEAVRHGEYDFGSYKRGYLWAKKHKILNKYDWVYFVNDSVYCLASPDLIVKDLELKKVDLTGIVTYTDFQTPLYVQSWFLGVSKKVCVSEFFLNFILNIKHQKIKSDIVLKYEVGFSRCIIRHGFDMCSYIPNAHNTTTVYDYPFCLLNQNVPFVKKKSITNIINIKQLYSYADSEKIVLDIEKELKQNNIKIKSNKYIRTYRLSMFGIPVFQKYCSLDKRVEKGKLFGIPVYKSLH